jgi:hypothetical protein
MGDSLGILRLPVPVPLLNGKVRTKTRAPGDPGLQVIASFIATVLQREIAAAWASFIPNDPVLADHVDVDRDGIGPVRMISFHDPRDMRRRQRSANLADFPALYVFRAADTSKLDQVAEDYPIRTTTILVTWVPRPPSDTKVSESRDPFFNAVSVAVCAAINYGQHPAWILPSDLDQPTALLAATATSTAPATIAIQAQPTIEPARRLLLTTAPAAGAYTVGSRVTFTGKNARGRQWSDTVTITNADGGEALHTVWPFSEATSMAVEAQALTTGSFTLGLHESSETMQGSMMERAAGFCRCFVARTGILKPIPVMIAMATEPTGMAAELLDAYEIAITVEELIVVDLAERGDVFEGVDPSQFLPNGTLFSTDQLNVP